MLHISYLYRIHTVTFLPFRAQSIDNQLIIDTGIENSRKHYSADKNGIPVLFATQMHEMARYLIDTMNQNADEYYEYVRRKEAWRRMMKKQNSKK